MNELHYLWIEGDLPRLQRTCLKSMIKLGYTVNLWTTALSDININNKNIRLRDANDILKYEDQHRLHYADLFRYTLLYEQGGTWIDADLFLFKRLPDDEIIISSEHCKKTGAMSKKYTDKTPNIGVIRMPPKDLFLFDVMKTCRESKAKLHNTSFMQIFNRKLQKYDYEKYVVEPTVYCPVSWANASELYCKYKGFKERWGIKQNDISIIQETSIGLHLWNNIYTTKGFKIEDNSVIDILENLVCNIDLTDHYICVPTFKRYEILNDKTLTMLDTLNIERSKINIFVENDTELDIYNEYINCYKYNFIVTNTKGIGAKRAFIRNYFAKGEKIVMIDDDISGLTIKNQPDFIFNDFINMAFTLAVKEKVSMWGVCVYDNEFYLKDGYTTNLKFISGALHGLILNDNCKSIKVDIDHFEDVENTLQHYITEGKILRFNYIGLKTRYYSSTGGICEDKGGVDKREEEALNNATYLIGEYGDYASMTIKKDGKINIRLSGR